MKIKIIVTMFYLLLAGSLMAQSSALKIEEARHGNTARRGILPRDENGNRIEPEPGYDFYTIQVKVTKNCSIETVRIWLAGGEVLPLSIQNGGTQQKAKKEETLILLANNQQKMDKKSNPNSAKKMKAAALLEIKINKKTYFLNVQNIEEILPQ